MQVCDEAFVKKRRGFRPRSGFPTNVVMRKYRNSNGLPVTHHLHSVRESARITRFSAMASREAFVSLRDRVEDCIQADMPAPKQAV